MISLDVMLERVHAIVDGTLAYDMADWSDWSEQERRDCLALAIYGVEQRIWRTCRARRKSVQLFRSWLTADERACLRQRRCVEVVGSAGGRYRIYPAGGGTTRIERHGTRWYGVARYCFHDPDGELPPADIALAHLLILKTDEPRFLATANATRTDLWDGAWLRRLNARRRAERAA